jgi:hypothetical protein
MPRNLNGEFRYDSDLFLSTHSAVYKKGRRQTSVDILLLSQ